MSIVLDFRSKSINQKYLEQAADHMRKGNILIAPTETGYAFVGLASHKGVAETFARLRPTHDKHKPFSLLCSDIAAVTRIALLDTPTFRLAAKVWPGPYTLVLSITKHAPKIYEKRKTVGIRISSNPVTRELCKILDCPVMATSVTDASELIHEQYFDDHDQELAWWTTIQGIMDFHSSHEFMALCHDEPIEMHVSTVLDCSQGNVEVLRDGGWDVKW